MWGGRKVIITSFGGEIIKCWLSMQSAHGMIFRVYYIQDTRLFLSINWMSPTSQGMFILSSMRSLEQYKAGWSRNISPRQKGIKGAYMSPLLSLNLLCSPSFFDFAFHSLFTQGWIIRSLHRVSSCIAIMCIFLRTLLVFFHWLCTSLSLYSSISSCFILIKPHSFELLLQTFYVFLICLVWFSPILSLCCWWFLRDIDEKWL